MDKFTHLCESLAYLFDDERSIQKVQAITSGILKARSCRISEIAREMPGEESANYKCVQRFVAKTRLKSNLLRVYQEEAPFLIGDPTEMPRPEAKKTDDVGLLGLDKMMHRNRHWMEQMVCLALIADAIGLVLGETLRTRLFPDTSRKHKLYSGLFVLLKLHWSLPYQEFRQVNSLALQSFRSFLIPVRTPV